MIRVVFHRAGLFVPTIAVVALVLALGSCGGETPGTEPQVPSPATSTASISSTTVASGSTITATVQLKDASGANLPTTTATVALSLGSGGTSDGTFSAVTGGASGSYTASFTGTTAGTPRPLVVTVGGVALTTAMPTITVTPGPASVVTSVVNMSASTVVTGGTATITLQARDAAGNNLTGGGLTVAFGLASTGTSSGTIGPVTDNGNGTYTATFTGTTAGTLRGITATINGAAVGSPMPVVTVTAGAASAATSTTSVSSATVVSGSTVTVTVQARDAGGNALSAGGATVTLALSGTGTSSGTFSSVTDNANGSYTATFTGTTSGTARAISATINGSALTTTQPTVTVTPGAFAASQSQIIVGSPTVVAGSTTTLTLQLRDAAGNATSLSGATVVFTLGSGSSAGTIGTVTDNGSGSYSAIFTATATGTARAIGATVNGTAVTSTAPTITVTSGAPSVSTSLITVASASIASGASTTVTLQAKDGAGNTLTSGGATIVFALAGSGTSAGTFSGVTDNGNGTYTATFTGTTAGTARAISGTINGSAVTTTQPTVTVTPGPISVSGSTVTVGSASIASGTTTLLTLRARDAAGNAITTGGATITFALSGGGTSSGTISAVTDSTNGVYTAVFTGTTSGTPRTISATINAAAVTSTLPAVTVTPGAPSAATSLITVEASTVASGSTIRVTVQAKDAAGNSRTQGGAAVVFSKSPSAGTSDGTIGSSIDSGDGTYYANFTGTTAGTPLTISATINGAAITTPQPTITVFTPGITLSSTNVMSVATAGSAGTQELVGVFANGGASAAGLQASISYASSTNTACGTALWLGTPVFDTQTASPAAILSFTPNATNLGIYSCTATVTVSSTTPGVTSKTFNVTLSVARGIVATTAVNVVMMGNAGASNSNIAQPILPDVRILITNGGRGVVTGLHATVIDQVADKDPQVWLATTDLTWEPAVGDTNQRRAPATLVVHPAAKPFSASAKIKISGIGIADILIPVNVLFNTAPEIVTNPRNVVLNGFAGGASVSRSVVAFNQNREVKDSLLNYAIDPGVPLPSWLSATVAGLPGAGGTDTAATVSLTANPTGLLADSVVSTTVRVTAQTCSTANGTLACATNITGSDSFDLPVTFVLERGLVVSATDVNLFAALGSTAVTKDIPITNGGSTEISGLSATITGTAAPWLSATVVGGTTAPATLRLTANPTGLARGSTHTTTVTISASSPSGVPSRSVTVTFKVY